MGRPPSKQSPIDLLHDEMNSAARLSQRVRQALQREVKQIERQLRSSQIQPGQRLELMDALLTVMTALDRSAESCGRLLTQKHSQPIPTDTPSQEEIMHDLLHGNGPKKAR
jgi:hypothetical protein